jgi:hypothetical protein
MSAGSSEISGAGGGGSTPGILLQEELQDLRSLVAHSDHLRWVTRDALGSGFDATVQRFAEDWRRWSESVARSLIDLGTPPDGRVSALTEGSYRAWLPDGWVEIHDAEQWLRRELGVLAEWAHVRREQVGADDFVELFETIETGVGAELTAFAIWSAGRAPSILPVEEQPRSR